MVMVVVSVMVGSYIVTPHTTEAKTKVLRNAHALWEQLQLRAANQPLGGQSRRQGVLLLQANLAGPTNMFEGPGDQGSAPVCGLKKGRREKHELHQALHAKLVSTATTTSSAATTVTTTSSAATTASSAADTATTTSPAATTATTASSATVTATSTAPSTDSDDDLWDFPFPIGDRVEVH